MHPRLIQAGRDIINELIIQCTEEQQIKFNRIYSYKNPDLPVDKVISKIKIKDISNAISLCERTIEKNKSNNLDL